MKEAKKGGGEEKREENGDNEQRGERKSVRTETTRVPAQSGLGSGVFICVVRFRPIERSDVKTRKRPLTLLAANL